MSAAEATTGERLVAVETRLEAVEQGIKDMKACLTDIAGDVKTALMSKADWATVTELGGKVELKADADKLELVNTALNKRLPLWTTFLLTGQGAVIGALLTALWFMANQILK